MMLLLRRLRFPEVPCVNAGTPRKPVWLPPELCWVVKAQRKLKLDERQARGRFLARQLEADT